MCPPPVPVASRQVGRTERATLPRVRGLGAVPFLAVAVGWVLAVARPGGYALLPTVFEHTLLAAALLALTGLGVLRHRQRVSWGRALIAASLLGACSACIAWIAGVQQPESRSPGPSGGAEVLVRQYPAVIDPVWYVSVREGRLLTQERAVACLNGDDPRDALASVRWVDDHRVEVRSSGNGAATVDLKQRRPATPRWGECGG